MTLDYVAPAVLTGGEWVKELPAGLLGRFWCHCVYRRLPDDQHLSRQNFIVEFHGGLDGRDRERTNFPFLLPPGAVILGYYTVPVTEAPAFPYMDGLFKVTPEQKAAVLSSDHLSLRDYLEKVRDLVVRWGGSRKEN